MDYKQSEHFEDLIKFIDKTMSKIQRNLTEEARTNQKRSANITYWLDTYSHFLKKEKTFDPKYIPCFRQGDVIQVNFGFRIGNEFGGLHYAVVLNNDDNRKSGLVTVVPLTSKKKKIA